ncbi:MAG TPA: hypothetical protein VLF61_04745 [Rhabdochlamydiaceae bacterium]|nr:hypothetical protein [Rhabdochlamydiaceae bacterium]
MSQILSKNRFFSNFLRRWGWVFLFTFLCWGLYAKGMQKKKEIFLQLDTKIKQMELQRLTAMQKREDLRLQIESQTDPAWIEMLLKKKLGVVPEGQIKVYFERD